MSLDTMIRKSAILIGTASLAAESYVAYKVYQGLHPLCLLSESRSFDNIQMEQSAFWFGFFGAIYSISVPSFFRKKIKNKC